uniref:uncharacterized protein LOC124058021 n=1 Tax=Scatophagus argus TaxID=75038 RepID=UPI001ED82C88|nr:uncharacterized protein LOC124058021 [Scatophagus argus]XP_046242801.1 uncharacterized protein LOC124058021 [Scatophagus argus]
MSESEANPQILVNGEGREQQEDEAAAAGGQSSSVSPVPEGLEDGIASEKETQAKMQAVFQQVRTQIRSQMGVMAPKSSLLELMQRVKDLEVKTAQVSDEPEEKEQAETLTDESKGEMDLKQEELCAAFERKLEDCKKALRDEFEVQISQVRVEMQAYTDQTLRDLECKMQSRQPQHPKEQQEGKDADKKQKPATAAPPPLASRRGRVLTRTMTTIIPKTCAPIIVGPRAKSETLSSSKGESSRLLRRNQVLPPPGNKLHQSHKPLAPPAYPPLHQLRKPVRAKAKAGN